MHEPVVAAVIGRDEAKALGRVEPLNCSGCHFIFSKNARMRDAPVRVSCGLDPISAMSWGRKPVRRGQQGRSTIRMPSVYAIAPDIASDKHVRRCARATAGNRIIPP